MVGEIHLATDALAARVRPVLLLKRNGFNDVLYLPLTTNLLSKGIAINNTNSQDGYLPKASVMVYEKPGVVARTLLLRKITTVDKNTFAHTVRESVSFIQQ